ncbi:phytanoyl-CoA dioxygenase family protein [Methylophilaceae bacterium]|nr:phytanoyl-CoA dioxygenase family protein [Methylophilaceae bacterium]
MENIYFNNGIHIERNVFSTDEVDSLRQVFFKILAECTKIRTKLGVEIGMENTVHHVLFKDEILQKLIEKDSNKKVLENFFDGKKYVLNSFGGNNNIKENYASRVHRDVRFYSQDKLMLNSIWCISPLNKKTGATQFLLGSHLHDSKPTLEKFNSNFITVDVEPGSIVYFDSRIWHRAGTPTPGIKERIIFTPIYTRPFIKPGFNYSKACQSINFENSSDYIKQISSYYSDVPETHEEWYDFNTRRFYLKDQDL